MAVPTRNIIVLTVTAATITYVLRADVPVGQEEAYKTPGAVSPPGNAAEPDSPARPKPLRATALLATLQLDTAAAAQRIVSRACSILPMDFKLQLRNMSGVAFGATLNTLKYRRFYDQ